MEEVNRNLDKIYEHFGEKNQVEKLLEEITELRKELIVSGEKINDRVLEELADVLVVGMQLYRANKETMEKIIKHKVNRTLERIKIKYYERSK